MKKIVIFTTALLFVFSSFLLSQDINRGLVAYYPFNGNADDESGYENHGTVNGATLTNDRFGNPNSAYDFDGANDEISCTVNSTLSSFASSNHSISIWVKMDETPSTLKFLVDYGESSRDQEGLRINSSGKALLKWVTDPAVSAIVYANNSFSINTWYHIVGVVEGTIGKLFINGQQVNTVDVGKHPNSALFNSLKIGNISGGGTGDGYFNGKIDDIKIFNRVLTKSEIQLLLNDNPTDIEEISTFPKSHKLFQNYPNPFNPSTMVKYELTEQSNVKIEIFNTLGQSVAVLVNTEKQAGFYETTWNAGNLPSGIYLISIRAEGLSSKKSFVQVKKALLLK